jgi:transposase
LTYRRNLKRKFLDLKNAIRHSLKVFGIRLNRVGRSGFAQALREACAGDALVAGHELCRRFMQIPGVGRIAALSFMTAVDDPLALGARVTWRHILG